MKKAVLAGAGVLATWALAPPLQAAQSEPAAAFPAKPVRLLVGFSPGSSTDTVARTIAPKIAESWKQPVVIDNRAGAGGNIAAENVVNANADGYTLLFANNGLVISRSLYRKLPFDALRDLEPVTQVTAMPHVLSVSPSLPASSVKELIALAKSKPGELNFASAGTGNSDHMAGELFKFMSGANLVHVPYKGGPPALTAAMTGEVAMYFGGLPVSVPQIKAGKVKALAVTGAKRSAALPNVPTVAEAGLPGYEVNLWYGIFAPAKTPRATVARLASEAQRALKAPDVQERLTGLGVELVGSSPEQFRAFVQSENAKWSKVVKATGLTVD